MTRAVQIAELGDQNVFTIDGDNNRVGIGSTLPTVKLDVGGVVVATAFTGDGSNLTGINLSYVPTAGIATYATTAGIATYATTAGIATNAQGLTGTPDISVTNITGVGATFSGDLNVTGTLTYEDVTNVDSIGIITARTGVRVTAGGIDVTAGVSTFSGAQKVSTGAEKVHRQSGNTVTLSFNSTSSSNVGYTTNPDGNITLAVTDIPTSSDFDDHSITFALIVNSTGTARTCTAVTLNGVSKTIRWAGGSLDTALTGVTTTTGHSIFNFTGINTVGSASTTANYEVFGIVSGGFF